MTEPEFDADGYPVERTLQAIRDWDYHDAAACLDFVKAAWHWDDWVGHDLRPSEAEVANAEPGERYLRCATGGWSGNEDLIGALRENRMIHAFCWRMSARGGLHIYRYPSS